jgi:hypothetical protein
VTTQRLSELDRSCGALIPKLRRRTVDDERTKRRESQMGMLAAADTFLREMDATLASGSVKPGSLRVDVPYALYVRMMQLARAISFLGANGYGEEAKPLARAILSTSIAIKVIVGDDLRNKPPLQDQPPVDFEKVSDGRALAYLSYHTFIRRRLNQAYLRRGWVDRQRVEEVDREVDAQDAATLAEYEKQGITPIKLGTKEDSWHGLSDEAAATLVGVPDWYDLYYRPFSEESHGSEPAIRAELERLAKDGIVKIGPRYDDPFPVLNALLNAVGAAMLGLDRQFGLGRADDIEKTAQPFVAAIKEHQESMDAVTWRRMMTP